MDIVKAIGIISIVMGHCCYSIMIPALNVSVGEFVYSYHLMVFFFVAGFFYKREYHKIYTHAIKYSFCTSHKNGGHKADPGVRAIIFKQVQ